MNPRTIDLIVGIFSLVSMAVGFLTIVHIVAWSLNNKQYSTLKGLLAFIFGTLTIFSISNQIQEFYFILSIFGVSFIITYILYKNNRESSIITFIGIIFFNSFQLRQRSGTEGLFGPVSDFELRILILLLSTGLSFIVLYTYFKSADRSIKGSFIGLSIISILLIIEILAHFKLDFNFMLGSPFWISFLFIYISPILIGFSIMKLTGIQ